MSAGDVRAFVLGWIFVVGGLALWWTTLRIVTRRGLSANGVRGWLMLVPVTLGQLLFGLGALLLWNVADS